MTKQRETPGRFIDPNRKGDWVPMFSGTVFWPLDPRPDEVRADDLAHHLAQKNRFGGALPQPYSVAQHSVLVALRVQELTGQPQAALYGLLHDGAEAVLSDLVRPVKRDPAMVAYRTIEASVQACIYEAFGLCLESVPEAVKQADEEVLSTEVHQLCPWYAELRWDRHRRNGWQVPYAPLRYTIAPYSFGEARRLFLNCYRRLTGDHTPAAWELPPSPTNERRIGWVDGERNYGLLD